MRKIFPFIGAILITVSLIALLDWHHPFGSPLPRLGMLFSPAHGFWAQAEPAASVFKDKQWKVPRLSKTVQVRMDDRLVPHIYAPSTGEAVFVQGYITASLRLWQMDLATRAAGGELSELLGEQTLEYDRIQRRKGMQWAAENFMAAINSNPEEKSLLEWYTAGINAYIDQLSPRDYPLEYKLLNAAPRRWEPIRSALMIKRMAETLASRNLDIQSTNARHLLGNDLFADLFPEYNPKQSPIIPEEVAWAFTPLTPAPAADIQAIGQRWKQKLLPVPPPFLGSNNWAVSGSKTASGRPILCNDPHLELSLPSIWFEIQIHTPELNAYGVSIPGLPGILIGFNEDIAWGETNVGHDVLDWYAVKWLDKEKTRYLLDDEPRAVEQKIEKIRVAGRRSPVLDTVKYTVWGPIVYDEPASPYYDLAMRWLAHDKQEKRPFYEISSFLNLMRAKNYEEYSNALTGYDVPAQNFVFASREGDIAIKVNGKFPVRAPQQGRFVQDGSSSANGWQQFIPREQVPQVKNPSRGFVSSANQHSTSPDYPYYYIGEFDDYRGRILNRLLDSMNQITVQDMMKLQCNAYSIVGEEATPLILSLVQTGDLNAQEKEMYQLLKTWDFKYVKEAKAPVVAKAVLDTAFHLTFDELIDQPDGGSMAVPELWRFIALLQDTPKHPIFDRPSTDQVEDAAAILRMAFKKVAGVWYEPLFRKGDDWGTINGAYINHLLRLPAFSRPHLYVDGFANALNATRGNSGPSWRMVVQLGTPVEAYGVYPGGQSGNPGSPFYESMVDQWAAGQYNRLQFLQSPNQPLKGKSCTWTFHSL